LAFLADNDDSDAPTLEITSSEWTNTTQTAWAEIDGMRCRLGKIGRFRPMDWGGEDLLTQKFGKTSGVASDIRS
jgi:hypothetical protein